MANKTKEDIQKFIDSGTYPKDIRDAVDRWDQGKSVWSVEMGGIGPGYEQCIQVGMIEVLRRLIGKEIPGDQDLMNALFEDTLNDVIANHDLGGLSGAQAGAIKDLACKFVHQGWLCVEGVDDRMILISKHWPK